MAPPPCYEEGRVSLSVGLVYLSTSIFALVAAMFFVTVFCCYAQLKPFVKVLQPAGRGGTEVSSAIVTTVDAKGRLEQGRDGARVKAELIAALKQVEALKNELASLQGA
jgi:hypothetical protein